MNAPALKLEPVRLDAREIFRILGIIPTPAVLELVDSILGWRIRKVHDLCRLVARSKRTVGRRFIEASLPLPLCWVQLARIVRIRAELLEHPDWSFAKASYAADEIDPLVAGVLVRKTLGRNALREMTLQEVVRGWYTKVKA